MDVGFLHYRLLFGSKQLNPCVHVTMKDTAACFKAPTPHASEEFVAQVVVEEVGEVE